MILNVNITTILVNPSSREWKIEEIGFFEPDIKDSSINISMLIVLNGRYTIYRNIFDFINRLKDMVTRRSEDKLRTILPKYLKGST